MADVGNGRGLAFVQYGAFRDDYRRLASGGAETYQAQRRAVDLIADTAGSAGPTTVVNVVTDDRHDEALAPGLRSIGLGPGGPRTGWRVWWRLLDRLDPARLILRTPLLPVMAWAVARRRRCLVVLADSFSGGGPRSRVRRLLLGRLLRRRVFNVVANHGRAASFQLEGLGIAASKIVPWDWAPARTPHAYRPKMAPAAGRPFVLAYAGALSAAKGADDLLHAVALLAADGRDVRATLMGGSDAARLKALAVRLGIAERVDLAGLVPNEEVVPRMREADAVVIPSRHDYPEGLPLTIYEALVSRTPIVASDHPMFAMALNDGRSALVFPAGDPSALAARAARLMTEPALYAALSEASVGAWERLQLPVTFDALVTRWLAGDAAWLAAYSLASFPYRETTALQ